MSSPHDENFFKGKFHGVILDRINEEKRLSCYVLEGRTNASDYLGSYNSYL